MKTIILCIILCISLSVKGQLIKNESVKYLYNAGGTHVSFILSNNLCHYLYCNSQAKRLGNIEDTSAFNNSIATGKFQRLRWWDRATYDTTHITWTYIYRSIVLTSTNGINFRGSASLMSDSRKSNVIKGSIFSENTQYGNFSDNINGQFTSLQFTGTINYNYYDSLIITLTSPVQTSLYYWVAKFQERYYESPEALIEFDVPYGYWCWFLKSDIPGHDAKIPILSSGRSVIQLLTDKKIYSNSGTLNIK